MNLREWLFWDNWWRPAHWPLHAMAGDRLRVEGREYEFPKSRTFDSLEDAISAANPSSPPQG